MDHKKKYHGGLLAFCLLCCVFLFGNISISYAYVSQEYVDYALDTLLENGNWVATNGYNHETGIKQGLNKLKEYNVLLKTQINEMLDYYNLSDIPDRNIIFLFRDIGTYIKFYATVSNCTYPGNYELGYLRVGSAQFSSYDPDNPSNNTSHIYGISCISQSSGISSWTKFDKTGNDTESWSANLNGYTWSQDLTNITFTNLVACGLPVIYTYNPMNNLASSSTNIRSAFVFGAGGNYQPSQPEPEEPSGDNPSNDGLGNITNSSGDNTGNINLLPIQEGLNNIQNQISGDSQRIIENQNQNTQTIVNTISGEVSKINNTLTDSADNLIDETSISSGDITNALGFQIATNPYDNFWTTLTNNLKTALFGSKRSIDISFQGRTWTISLDNYLVLPVWLTIILIPISTCLFVWLIVREWKLIFNKFATGNVDSLLKENSQERYFQFVLRGFFNA